MLVLGNKKLWKRIGIFNLPPGRSCPNHEHCLSRCYAMKAWRQYPNVRKAWTYNFDLSHCPQAFWNAMTAEIMKLRPKLDAVRIHSAGDFYNSTYLLTWFDIIREFPDLPFYAYTKNMTAYGVYKDGHPANFNLIPSFIGGHLNFGSLEHCVHLIKEHGAILCPCQKGEEIVCGFDCRYCLEHDKPCFLEH